MARRLVIASAIVLFVFTAALFVTFSAQDAGLASQPASPITPTLTLPALTKTPTLAQPTPSKTPTAIPIPPIHLAWFYRPPANRDLVSLAKYFDVFILTRLDEPTRDSLRARSKRPFLQYLRADAIHDPGACNREPYQNQVAFKVGDYCQLLRNHPDWFLRDTNGNLISKRDAEDGARYVWMDPGNSGWRAFWLERARSLELYGWDGVFLDNVEASRSKLARQAIFPAKYPDDSSYQTAIAGFLSYLSANYFRPNRRPLFANIIENQDDAAWFRYVDSLDGAMQESFAVDWLDGYLDADEWEAMMQVMEKTQALGKQVILVSQGKQADAQRQLFAFASYLLINSERASFRYTQSNSYSDIWLYPAYDLDLGSPLGPRYRDANGWRRDFANASVFVEPSAHTAAITLRR